MMNKTSNTAKILPKAEVLLRKKFTIKVSFTFKLLLNIVVKYT